ncbi:MAG TPA: c-type cytochrome domain-containing protein [Gemmataceae bacterium]|nr:c-type cytochrome domain-containing protein [Gemmataceae bacterium]
MARDPFDFSGKPRRRPARRPSAPVKKRRDYPVAQPYAPPPGWQQAPPVAEPIVRRPAVPPSSRGDVLKVAAVVVGVGLVGLAAGWYFFRGPGRAAVQEMGEAARGKGEPPAAVVAEAPRDAKSQPPGDAVPDRPRRREEAERRHHDRRREERPEDDRREAGRKNAAPPGEPRPAQPMPQPTPQPAPMPGGLTFTKNILPLFEAKCVSCHGGGKKKGGLDVRTVAALLKGGENGPALVPGNLEKSSLWDSIDTNRMPPGRNKLTPAEKKLIHDWIAAGARDGGNPTARLPN